MAHSIMIQGTMSGVGKSLLVAGLCRIFKQDGFSVAPFKSQNMALNSAVTKEGLEIGRAQAMQAEACKIEPSVLMNPVLLKPDGDTRSQVIVNGEVFAEMNAKDYYAFKKNLIPQVKKSYEELSSLYDIIVIEGAGSPAEINLKENDFANMGMAEIAKCPVLLVGDIDRGGVFAQLAGTMELLEKNEKEKIKAFVVNKFRGDKEILNPGIKMLEERMKIRVAGVVPYLKINLDDEDSLSPSVNGKNKNLTADKILIGVIKFPHISNFTDFSILGTMENVHLDYISSSRDLSFYDFIILPGTKNTLGDLQWLKDSFLYDDIKKYAKTKKPLLGICGGYQILGQRLEDESCGNESFYKGLGLLPLETIFCKEKKREKKECLLEVIDGDFSCLSKSFVSGYEIHLGRTGVLKEDSNARKVFPFTGDSGFYRENIYGTYLHGFFDEKGIAVKLISFLAEKKGLKISYSNDDSWKEIKEKQFNFLAGQLRLNLDMNFIYEILGVKPYAKN